MRSALAGLRLRHLAVVYPGERRYALAPRATAVPMLEVRGASRASLFGRNG